MKRVIYCSTRDKIADTVVEKFRSTPGVASASKGDVEPTYCKVHISFDQDVYPGVKDKTITVWYDFEWVKGGSVRKTRVIKWSPSYSVNDDGSVLDSDGNKIGKVKVVQKLDEVVNKRKRKYTLHNVRTNTGDLVIDHPESVSDSSVYQSVVDQLSKREIKVKS